MLLARVEGNVVATRKHPSFEGWRLVICQPIRRGWSESEGAPQVAIDPHGAGMHQRVVISSDGAAARKAVGDEKSPARWMSSELWTNRNRECEYETRNRHRPGDVERKPVQALEGGRCLVVSPFSREHFAAGLDAPRGHGQ